MGFVAFSANRDPLTVARIKKELVGLYFYGG
jgi:hypothetical protein